jgi:phage-related protein
MDTLPFNPSKSTQGKPSVRTLKARFGDGYEQRAADGINNVLRTWNAVWSNYHHVDADPNKPSLKALNDFFTTQGGWKKFLWVQPPPFDIEGAKTFVCDDWDWVYDEGLIVGIRATLEQRPT